MTLEEKLAQLVGFWVKDDGRGGRAARRRVHDPRRASTTATAHGLGHLTRVYGTRPVDADGAAPGGCGTGSGAWCGETRLGIPAVVHEECLTGLAAWGAATYPTPLAWGAPSTRAWSTEMAAPSAARCATWASTRGWPPCSTSSATPAGAGSRSASARTPTSSARIGTAYVRGLQSAGRPRDAQALRRLLRLAGGPQLRPRARSAPRELADVFLPPFEMAVLDGGARSVMHSYTDIDGVPARPTAPLLTGLLRDEWGFDGTVVADYFAVAFLHLLHGVAADLGDAAAQALAAGIDVELPDRGRLPRAPGRGSAPGEVDEALVDRAVLRALAQKAELGLLDATLRGRPAPASGRPRPGRAPRPRRPARRGVGRPAVERRPAPAGPAAPASPSSAPTPTGPRHSSGATRSSTTCCRTTPAWTRASRSPPSAQALAEEWPDADHLLVLGLRRRRRGHLGARRRRGRRDGRRRRRGRRRATTPACSAVGPSARAPTGTTSSCPGYSAPSSRRCSPRAPPSSSCSSPVGPYAVGWALERCAAVVQAFFPGEEGVARDRRGALRDGSTPRAGCR